jgi:hypothetical protein
MIHPTTRTDVGTPRVAGVFTDVKLGASADILQFSYDEYTLGGIPITNARAYIVGFTAGAGF